jgi:hypothetical protein
MFSQYITMEDVYLMYTIRMIITGIALFGSLHYGAMVFDYNLAEYLNLVFFRVFRKRGVVDKVIYAIFAVCALFLVFDRTTWLPFLGDTVLPSALIPLKTNIGDTTVDVKVTPGAKVAFWAAKPGADPNINVKDAYDDYSNSGVVMANDLGVATLTFNKGTDYVVPSGKHITSHVHYREFSDKRGMAGPVKSVFV